MLLAPADDGAAEEKGILPVSGLAGKACGPAARIVGGGLMLPPPLLSTDSFCALQEGGAMEGG